MPEPGQMFMGFSTQKGVLSWFIRTATASQASHSFLLFFSETFDRHMVLEVQGRGFVQIPWDKWNRENRLLAFYELKREEPVIEGAMNSLGERLGDPYDKRSLLGFLLIYVVRVWDRNDLDDKKKLVCSEMVALFLRWSRVPMKTHIGRVVPEDLWSLAEQRSEDFIKRYETDKGRKKLSKVRKRASRLLEPNF